jgi:hypothetical protein
MLRLLLVLLVGMAIMLGGLYLNGRRAKVAGAPDGSGPPQVRAVVRDMQKIEAQNRAALDRTVESASGTR